MDGDVVTYISAAGCNTRSRARRFQSLRSSGSAPVGYLEKKIQTKDEVLAEHVSQADARPQVRAIV
jgi:hypothetical protein